MTPENVTRYRVKAIAGYFYTVGNGRYGRWNGSRLSAEILCAEHADAQIKTLTDIAPEYEPTREDYPGTAACAICKRQGKP